RFFLRNQRHLAVERIGLAVPVSGNVAIAPKRDQSPGTRIRPKARRQRQVTSRRATHDGESVAVDMEQLRPFVANPPAGALQLRKDGRQFCLRRQAIVNGYDRVTSLE